jgi:hypothetical protein
MADDVIDPNTYGNIAKQWTDFLDQPGGRAAILSAGLALSQPRHWGQDNFAHLMSAIGTGGEAVGRVEEMNRKQQESDTKLQLAEARMQNIGERGQTNEARQRYLESETARRTLADQSKRVTDFARLLHSENVAQDKKYKDNVAQWQKDTDFTKTAAEKAAAGPRPVQPPRITPDELIRRSPQYRDLAPLFGGGESTSIPSAAGPTAGVPSGPVQVKSLEEAARLPSGTRIILPDGSPGRVP